MNYYDTLGIDRSATPDDIKKAYRKLASTHHPDKGGDTQKFQEIQKSYDTLSDPNKRAQYDHESAFGGVGGGAGPHHFHFNMNSGMDPEDMGGMGGIFDHIHRQFGFSFGARGGHDPFSPFQQANANRNPRNRDVRISMSLTMLETLSEQTKTLTVTLPGNMKETVEIKVPRGVGNGTTIRYPGLGDRSVPNAPRADLYIQFHIQPDPNFELHGIDLVTTLTINCLDAIVGCEKEVTGLDGKKFNITIPPGTQYGAKFGIPEQGLYSTDHAGRGRLIVSLEIYIPKDLTEPQLNTIKNIHVTL